MTDQLEIRHADRLGLLSELAKIRKTSLAEVMKHSDVLAHFHGLEAANSRAAQVPGCGTGPASLRVLSNAGNLLPRPPTLGGSHPTGL